MKLNRDYCGLVRQQLWPVTDQMSYQLAILFAEPFQEEQPLKTFSFLTSLSMNINTEEKRRKEAKNYILK